MISFKKIFRRRKSSKNEHNDTFIRNFNRNNSANNASHAALCCKRVIFISIVGLLQKYNSCPAHILYSSLIIIPLKRKWIHSPTKYSVELQSVSSGLIREDQRSRDFIELIKWKDSQGFVFWAKDESKTPSDDNIVHPFWQNVSRKLLTLSDPITSKHYAPLVFDVKYWRKQTQIKPERSESNAKQTQIKPKRSTALVSDVFREMYFMTLNFESIKRLINTSNPKSFRVLTAYNDDILCSGSQFVKFQELEHDSDTQSDDEWWIASDYFVNEI